MNMLVIAALLRNADFTQRRHEVAVAQVALLDVRVGGAVDKQCAGELPVGRVLMVSVAAGHRMIDAQEPFADQILHLGAGGAGRQIAERLPLDTWRWPRCR